VGFAVKFLDFRTRFRPGLGIFILVFHRSGSVFVFSSPWPYLLRFFFFLGVFTPGSTSFAWQAVTSSLVDRASGWVSQLAKLVF
jgi:hypothetical protein